MITPVHPVDSVVPAAIRTLLRRSPMCPEKLAFAWRVAVGPAIDRATTIHLREDGVVEVRATDPAWRRELKKTEAVLHGRLGELLGAEVRGVKVITRTSKGGACPAR